MVKRAKPGIPTTLANVACNINHSQIITDLHATSGGLKRWRLHVFFGQARQLEVLPMLFKFSLHECCFIGCDPPPACRLNLH